MTTAAARVEMERRGVRIDDTFAEAFDMWAARVVITARSPAWALTAARAMTGFATSVIGCKVEAGIEAELAPEETPDGRPGVSVPLFAFDADGLGKRLVERVGQTVLTCPTTACFDGLPQASERVIVGGVLRHFGDRYQSSKLLDGLRYWRIPVMEGEFLVQETFGVQKAIGGGNFLILAEDQDAALAAAEAVVDALDRVAIEKALQVGIQAACRPGVLEISAGNYGGRLGKHHFRLHALLE